MPGLVSYLFSRLELRPLDVPHSRQPRADSFALSLSVLIDASEGKSGLPFIAIAIGLFVGVVSLSASTFLFLQLNSAAFFLTAADLEVHGEILSKSRCGISHWSSCSRRTTLLCGSFSFSFKFPASRFLIASFLPSPTDARSYSPSDISLLDGVDRESFDSLAGSHVSW